MLDRDKHAATSRRVLINNGIGRSAGTNRHGELSAVQIFQLLLATLRHIARTYKPLALPPQARLTHSLTCVEPQALSELEVISGSLLIEQTTLSCAVAQPRAFHVRSF